ncbi:hypothetical protein [Pseudoclavibacter helvolus]|uniref:hypothetical protein n=1 Tax=Pseudoclavibacter helvolus TaxID=255205 RepID=UPI00083807E5|nr:hypothetical protein [Pseudoclavibacter helvolus]
MTTINWERRQGEDVEDFAAAHLLLASGVGNRIRPGKGDRGIDVQIPTEAGWEIYQVKRFATNLSSSSKRQIRDSWHRFRDEILPTRDIKFWALVLPLDPTPENESWFAELTEGSGVTTRWIGRTTLDAWAADNPKIAAYFFGDGEQRLHDLMATALSGGQPPTADGVDPLLSSIQDRMLQLSHALDEVDPFYRYEIEVRSGSLNEPPSSETLRRNHRPGLVETIQREISDHQYIVTHVIARSPMSTVVRPVRSNVTFRPSTPEDAVALERFVHFGAPLLQAPGTIHNNEGPAGTTTDAHTLMKAWLLAPHGEDPLPPLEARLRDPDGNILATVFVTDAETTAGQIGSGRWFRIHLGPAVHFEYFIGSEELPDTLQVAYDPALTLGVEPHAVLPSIELVADLSGNSLEFAIRGGPIYLKPWHFDEETISTSARDYARFVKALLTFQQHSLQRITIPALDQLDVAELRKLQTFTPLLQGKTPTIRFDTYEVGDAEFFSSWDESPRSFISEHQIVIRIGGEVWNTNMNARYEFESVRIDRSSAPPILRPGNTDLVRLSAVPRSPGA